MRILLVVALYSTCLPLLAATLLGPGICDTPFALLYLNEAAEFGVSNELGIVMLRHKQLGQTLATATRLSRFLRIYPAFLANVVTRAKQRAGKISPDEALALVDEELRRGQGSGGSNVEPWPARRPLSLRQAIANELAQTPVAELNNIELTRRLHNSVFDTLVELESSALEVQAQEVIQEAEAAIDSARHYANRNVPGPNTQPGVAPSSKLEIEAGFARWLQAQGNSQVRRYLDERLTQLEKFGQDGVTDWRFLSSPFNGSGLREMRVHISPGYRIYYKNYGTHVRIFAAGQKPKEGRPDNYSLAYQALRLMQDYESDREKQKR